MRLASGSLSRHWAMGACLLLLWAATPTSTQARFITKRETAHVVDIGVVDAHTADPDIVRASSESASGSEVTATTTTEATATSNIIRNATEVELMLATTTTEAPHNNNSVAELQLKREELELTTTTSTTEAAKPAVDSSTEALAVEVKQETKQESANSEPTSRSTDALNSSSAVIVHNVTTAINAVKVELNSNSGQPTLQNLTTEIDENVQQKITAMPNEENLKGEQKQLTELQPELTTAPTTSTTTSATLSLQSTQRAEDHGRSMQFPVSTENSAQLSAVTPMKLRALPMKTTTTTTTTHMPQLLAVLLHAGVTTAPRASHENAIDEEQLQPLHEKSAKYMSDNATNAQQLLLPNGAEVWSLAAMKMVPTTTTTTTSSSSTTTAEPITSSSTTTELANEIEQLQNRTEQHKEKNLLDWQQIMLMQTSQENRTELTMGTTLDATEAATQATTIKLDAMLNESEMDVSASSAVTASTLTNIATTAAIATTTTAENLTSAVVKSEPELAAEKLSTTATAQPDLTEQTKLDLTAEAGAVVTAQPDLTELTKLSSKANAATAGEIPITTTSTALPKLTEQEGNTEATATETPKLTELEKFSSAVAATEPKIAVNATTMTPAALATAVQELPATTTTTTTMPTTTTTALPSALNGTPNANEMAMKATAHENNENSDKSNNVDSDDVINVSVAVSVSTETTLAATTVSTRTAGEASTTETPTPTTTSTSRTLLDEQLAKTIITTTTTLATPTPTETVQISNEVNLETITVKNVTKDNDNKNNVQASGVNNLLITSGERSSNSSDVNSPKQAINNSDANSEANGQTQLINNNSIYSTTTPASLLTDIKANSKLNEQETNNIGETETTAATTTATTAATATTTVTVRSIATTETSVLNALDESTATTIITAATPATAASKGASDLYEDHQNNDDDDVDVDNDDEEHKQQQIDHDSVTEQQLLSKANMTEPTIPTPTTTTTTTTEAATRTTTTSAPTTTRTTTTTTEEPFISLLDDSTTTTTAATTTTTHIPTTTTTTEPIYSSTSNPNININSSTHNNSNSMLPEPSTTLSSANTNLPSTVTPDPTSHPSIMVGQSTEVNQIQQPHGNTGTDVNVIIAITVSVIGVVALILLVAFLYLMRKRQKQMSYGQRCRPVSLDAYSLDNVSVLGSVRRKGRDLRASKRTYGNAAFDDPSLRHNLLSATELGKFLERRSSIFEEFRDVPQIIARADEVPAGCEDKNRYANVIPLPETRVVLQRQGDDDKTEYINANYVRGPRDAPNYYIACQAPLESTTGDFWRMIWEQQSRVIVQATDLSENGIERCAEYLPPSVTLDNHSSYGDYQVTLKHREVKDKYAISTLMLKRVDGAECRELTHYWYKWPETGVPLEEAPIIAMLLEARSSLKSYAQEQANELKHEKSSTLTLKSLEGQTQQASASAEGEGQADAEKCSTSSAASNEINGNVAHKTPRSQQGPLTIHCSPGTGRTGTIIACDMAIRSLETPKRSVDIPQLVYYVRRGRASAVQTKEQYEFIYKVANMYATKITNLSNDN